MEVVNYPTDRLTVLTCPERLVIPCGVCGASPPDYCLKDLVALGGPQEVTDGPEDDLAMDVPQDPLAPATEAQEASCEAPKRRKRASRG